MQPSLLHRAARSAVLAVVLVLGPVAAALAQAPAQTYKLGGVYDATVGGVTQRAQVDAWDEIGGVRVTLGSEVHLLARSGDRLTAPGLTLTIASQDSMSGAFVPSGRAIALRRNKAVRARAVVPLPKDRPFYQTMKQQIAPAVNADRDSYFYVKPADVRTFVRSIDSFYWTWSRAPLLPNNPNDAAAEDAAFDRILAAVSGVKTTPRYLLSNPQFQRAVAAELPAVSSDVGRWVVNYGSYVAIGSGRGVLIPMDERPWPTGRGAKFYLLSNRASGWPELTAYMKTPSHATLPTTFGQWLKSVGRMPASDDASFYRHLLEVLARSDARRIASLSSTGQTASTDFVGITSAELYRAVTWAYGADEWPLDMIGLALNSAFVRASGKVIVPDAGWEDDLDLPAARATLRPGTPFYYDHAKAINERQGARFLLQRLCTAYERRAHPDLVARVERLLTVPKGEVRSPDDLIEWIARSLMDDRAASIDGQALVDAASEFLAQVQRDAAAIARFAVEQGVAESSERANP